LRSASRAKSTESLDLTAAALVVPEESLRAGAEQAFEKVLTRRS
jgi:hypothetical protein